MLEQISFQDKDTKLLTIVASGLNFGSIPGFGPSQVTQSGGSHRTSYTRADQLRSTCKPKCCLFSLLHIHILVWGGICDSCNCKFRYLQRALLLLLVPLTAQEM